MTNVGEFYVNPGEHGMVSRCFRIPNIESPVVQLDVDSGELGVVLNDFSRYGPTYFISGLSRDPLSLPLTSHGTLVESFRKKGVS